MFQAHHIYICDHHKEVIQSLRSKRKQKDSDDDNTSNDQDRYPIEVDFSQLQINTLRRYRRHFKIKTRPSANKAQLADTLAHHFKTIPIMEKEAIIYFLYMVKYNKNKLDQKMSTDSFS
ncbi:SAP30L [Cordylochernes scorpioides]|uniref:SAP30L n=1 Tax=Cordylochernes scorpioides TaxID=51811 RepID=A0ABY6LVZ0_9ARAC|nr:SAP30L [Cordylochernes scorpioides]